MKYFVIFDDEKLSLFRVDKLPGGSTGKVLVIKDEHNTYRGFTLYPIANNQVQYVAKTCKFRTPINCDFCAFHSDCDEHWKEGEAE